MFKQIYRGKRIFVTGHTGFKGSWLCQWLLDLGAAEVTGFSNEVPTKPSHFELAGLAGHMKDLRGDIRDGEALSKAIQSARADMLFHLAAQPLVRDSYDHPKATFDTNVGGTVNVLEGIRASQTIQAAVLVATDKCYENVEWEYGYREVDPLGGKDPYSASKGAAEIVFRSYARSFFGAESGKRVGSGRAGNVIGGHDWAKDRIIPDCMRAWQGHQPVTIRNPGSTRPWQHVLEPLSGYLALGAALWERQPDAMGESFNFGPRSDANRTVGELLEELKRNWKEASWKVDASQNGAKKEARFLQLVCEKAKARLDWEPTLTFPEAVKFTIEGYLAEKPTRTREQIAAYVELARQRGLSWAKS